tara:strand:+ start:562 stop:681 length:120 start_codon:yes stop_codon:yes gene_type:complete
MGKEGFISTKKIKIKISDGQNPKLSKRSNGNGTSASNLN